ncbi:MAG: hypothetical protein CL910_13475 [Deltaproteobacteria bacterium]|jgi:uncharacterized protein (DUF1330 family)|nr:hypothetical protein [Deltaproteobacteria bacterium]
MPVYIVAQIQIEDREGYARYEAGFMEVFAEFEGEILGVDEAVQTVEGDWPYTRTVLLRFPDADEARRWYESPRYQELLAHRQQASQANIILMHGMG